MKAIFTYGHLESELDVPLKDGHPPLYYVLPKPVTVEYVTDRADFSTEVPLSTGLMFRLDDYYQDKIAWYRFEKEV